VVAVDGGGSEAKKLFVDDVLMMFPANAADAAL
jgi:hypothetical protein